MGLSLSTAIKACCYSDKEQFHNYDSSIINEPLLGIYRPSNNPDKLQNLFKNIPIDAISSSCPWVYEDLSAVDQISALVHFAHLHNLKVRVAGTGASWSGVTKAQDILIETTKMNQILSSQPGLVWCARDQKTYSTVAVQSGMIVKDFCQSIDDRFGLALPILGNYAGQTVAGLVATSSHGSSRYCMTMASYVHAIYFVTEGGIKFKLRYQQPNERASSLDYIRRTISENLNRYSPLNDAIELASDSLMQSAVVSLGCYGVVYALEFFCEAAYDIAEVRTALNFKVSEGSGQKVKLPRLIRDGLGLDDHRSSRVVAENSSDYFFSFFMNPFEDENRSFRCTVLQGKKSARNAKLDRSVINMGSTACRCPLCWISCGTICERRGLNTTLQFIQMDISAASLHSVSLFGSDAMKREATTFAMYGFEHASTRVDKWFEILQITKGHMQVRTAEWCVPLESLEEALSEVTRITNKYCKKFGTTSLLPIFVRCMKSDNLTLSPANCTRPDNSFCDKYAFIEIPFLPGSYGIDEYHHLIESKMISQFNARPHWAKNNFLTSVKVEQVFPAQDLIQWREIASVFNQSNTFSNVYSDQCGLTSIKSTQPTLSR